MSFYLQSQGANCLNKQKLRAPRLINRLSLKMGSKNHANSCNCRRARAERGGGVTCTQRGDGASKGAIPT